MSQRLLATIVVAGALGAAPAAQQPISTPADFFGFEIGTDGELARYPRVLEYLRHLADHDLFDAIEAGLIEVEARGDGPAAVTLRIRRTGGEPLVITSPVATWFAAGGGGDMVARRDGWIVLADGAWRDWRLRAVGRRPGHDPPAAGQALEVRPPAAIPRIAAVLHEVQAGAYRVADSPTLYPLRTRTVEQAAVWIADGDPEYAALEPLLADARVPPQYAAAFALLFLDRADLDVTRRRVWNDRAAIFDGLRDQGLRVWYDLKTGGR